MNLTIYFPPHLDSSPRDVRRRLNAIAESLGYVSTAQTGPRIGRGSAAALLAALARGEIEIKQPKQEAEHNDNR